MKEGIVRVDQTDGKKGNSEGKKETEGREKREMELTKRREMVVLVGVESEGGKIRVKRACLLWQSPRPSVLPCSTSCSKADLQGTETSWSAAENRPGHAGSPHLTK